MDIYLKILLVGIVIPFLMYQQFKRLKAAGKEINAKESWITTEKRETIFVDQNKKNKIFISLAITGGIIILFLKNTLAGFYIGFASMAMLANVLYDLVDRWSKKLPFSKMMLMSSFLIMIAILALLGYLYYPQLVYLYSDRI